MTLLVFSDDWGRHPSSCQYLIRELLQRIPVVWVNTIGMRRPKLEWYTVTRGWEKLRHWFGPKPPATALPANLRVVNPKLWPGFGAAWERRINRRLFLRALEPVVAELPEPPIAITTIPTVADLIGRLTVKRWVYYCVDDFTTWPGLDHRTVERLENALIDQAERIIVVSETLREKMAKRGRTAELLTHGVDLDFWRKPTHGNGWAFDVPRPWLVFWGLIDRRMDIEILRQLSEIGSVILVGPEDNPDSAIRTLPNCVTHPAVEASRLPSLAATADILILPYADLPVTRAIQPLKLKEYLATGKPVVARDLPAVREWADCLDLSDNPKSFAEAVRQRLATGIAPAQVKARERLAAEAWPAKAEQFHQFMSADDEA